MAFIPTPPPPTQIGRLGRRNVEHDAGHSFHKFCELFMVSTLIAAAAAPMVFRDASEALSASYYLPLLSTSAITIPFSLVREFSAKHLQRSGQYDHFYETLI